MRFQPTRHKGFTLIELLVVIAIITILASILFPVFARARENARRTSCLSNLKQMGLAMMQYTQDYDESYPAFQMSDIGQEPPGGRWLGSTLNTWTWMQTLYPYHKSLQVFTCPSGVGTWKIRGHYGANANLISGTSAVVSIASVVAPSSNYAIMDAGYFIMYRDYANPAYSGAKAEYGYYLSGIGELGSTCADNTSGKTYASLQSDCESGRHFGGVNMAFADGHVKWLKTSVVSTEAIKPVNAAAGRPKIGGAWNPANS